MECVVCRFVADTPGRMTGAWESLRSCFQIINFFVQFLIISKVRYFCDKTKIRGVIK